MTDFLAWLVIAELLSFAALPLSSRLFAVLPDRGFPLAKIAGLLGMTWVVWLVTSGLPVAGHAPTLWAPVVVCGVGGWTLFGRETLDWLRRTRRLLLIEEAVFVAGFAVWSLVRAFHPDIAGTEKPMDLMYLQATARAAAFPPQDLWLAGHAVNYYYFGYLLMANLGRLAGSSVPVTYNLALAFIFGLALAGVFSLGFNLTRRLSWAALAPVMVVLLGNLHAFLFQVIDGRFPWNEPSWYWESSRVVGETAPGAATTINEFPMFSLILGDLHPHLLAVPTDLLSLTAALAILLSPETRKARGPSWMLLAGTAVITGSLAATNAWDAPTYLLIDFAALSYSFWRSHCLSVGSNACAAAAIAGTDSTAVRAVTTSDNVQHARRSGVDHRTRPQAGMDIAPGRIGRWLDSCLRRTPAEPRVERGGEPWLGRWPVRAGGAGAGLIVAALVAFFPFYLTYRSPTHGIGRVTTATDVGQFAQIFGFPGILAAGLIWIVATEQGYLARAAGSIRHRPQEAGLLGVSSFNAIDLLLAAAIVTLVTVVGVLQLWVLLLGLLLLVLSLLLSLSPNVRPTDRFVLTLVAVVGLIVAGCELFYVRDYFDETAFYRMNTVFKFYFQAWILLGVAGAYGGYRMVCHLRSIDRWAATLAMGVLSIGLVFGGVYTVLGPISYYGALDGDGISFGLHSLSGLESLQSQDPADFRAVSWIISSVSGSPRILEATGPDYSLFGRVSTYTGLPTILGWQGHEIQWRGADPLLNARHALVDAIYSTADIPRARRLLAANHITLVYVGPCERQVYGRGSRGVGICGETQPVSAPNTALTKFAKFMRTIYDRDGVQIYEAS